MKINKLTIVNGIIQDKFIGGIPVIVDIIEPQGNPNVRTLIPIIPLNGTYHGTANKNASATDSAHRKYFNTLEAKDDKKIGAMLFIDEDSITQALPLNEASYHTSDYTANRQSISMEICVNGDIAKAEYNAQMLGAALLMTIPDFEFFTHQDWTGKYCPSEILSRKNGWENFKTGIYSLVEESLEEGCTSDIEEAILNYHKDVVEKLIDQIEEQNKRIKELEEFKKRIEEAIAG